MTDVSPHDIVVPFIPASARSSAERLRRAPEPPAHDSVRDLELQAMRRDLDLQHEYTRHLERASDERQAHVLWLQSALDEERTLRVEAALRLEDVERRLATTAAELAAERSRTSYLVAQRLIALVSRRRVLTALLRFAVRGDRTKS